MNYNYKLGKSRINEILDNFVNIEDKRTVPYDDYFTYDNACKTWVTSIFVDIRRSTELFNLTDKENVTKIIRSFTSEIIEILNNNESIAVEEIGIRGDCVYAIYSTPTTDDTYEVLQRAFYVNTFIKMLNKLLKSKNMATISAGIGISTANEVIIKAGRKFSGVNSKVWIGSAVTKASKLSSLGNKNNNGTIIISSCTHYNIINKFKKNNGDNSANWFTKAKDDKLGEYYHCNITKKQFDEWIDGGMRD